MNSNVNKRYSLTLTNMLTKTVTLIVTLTLLLSVTLILPKEAKAASKEYEIYKQIKTGMTATQVAKLIYGKTYKKHLKKEYGVTTFKHEPSYLGGDENRINYEFGFFEDTRGSDKEFICRIGIGLFSKHKGKTLYVGFKNYNTKKPTVSKLYKNKKPKVGMSIHQLDKIAYRDGLGVFRDITYENLTFLKILNGKGKNMFPTKKSTISYVIKNHNDKKGYAIYLEYDYKKKNYYVAEQPF